MIRQVIRGNPASRGTETSAEVLIGPPWRMVSNAGQQQWYEGGHPLQTAARGRAIPPGDSTPAPPPSASSVGVGRHPGGSIVWLGNLVRPESHPVPEPRGFPRCSGPIRGSSRRGRDQILSDRPPVRPPALVPACVATAERWKKVYKSISRTTYFLTADGETTYYNHASHTICTPSGFPAASGRPRRTRSIHTLPMHMGHGDTAERSARM